MAEEESPEGATWEVPTPEVKPKLPICHDCKNHIPVEGSMQSSCHAPDKGRMVVVAWEKAINNGTFNWPHNYDSTQLVECDGGYVKKETN